ncbi:hypothetical protein HAX54_016192 [Datura stramonium]|uniref:Putative plant transposon protein domain-containing protein n=1 Tax=Datura stramonium TaxID=4076 RepID=A0ABS8UKQ3_DATST|nr:hypothetical protein [Datura stramonium]
MRGIQVECSAKAINKVCFGDDDADATDYLAKLENPDNNYTWIASLIAAGMLAWAIEGGQIFKSELNIQSTYWLGFVCSRLTPSENDNEVPISRAILISCIMAGVHINVRDIISIEMRDLARQAHTSLPFPVLVTNLCRDVGVPEIARIDENIWEKHVVDIKKIQDEMNPKLKKRKCEPHLSEASLTRDPQMMGNTVTGTSTQASDEVLASSLAPPVAPQPMCRTPFSSRKVELNM